MVKDKFRKLHEYMEHFQFQQIPARYRTRPDLYAKYRVRELKRSYEEAKTRDDFKWAVDFIHGRLAEAEETLKVLEYARKHKRWDR